MENIVVRFKLNLSLYLWQLSMMDNYYKPTEEKQQSKHLHSRESNLSQSDNYALKQGTVVPLEQVNSIQNVNISTKERLQQRIMNTDINFLFKGKKRKNKIGEAQTITVIQIGDENMQKNVYVKYRDTKQKR